MGRLEACLTSPNLIVHSLRHYGAKVPKTVVT